MTGVLLPYKNNMPTIASDAFVAPSATIIGKVVVGSESSIWFNCLLRGDVNEIYIGERTNIQDGSIVHVSGQGQGTHIGNDITWPSYTLVLWKMDALLV